MLRKISFILCWKTLAAVIGNPKEFEKVAPRRARSSDEVVEKSNMNLLAREQSIDAFKLRTQRAHMNIVQHDWVRALGQDSLAFAAISDSPPCFDRRNQIFSHLTNGFRVPRQNHVDRIPEHDHQAGVRSSLLYEWKRRFIVQSCS